MPSASQPLLPAPPEQRLGCHRPRVPDRLCLGALVIRLTTGSSWGRHRSDPRSSSVRHHTARTTRRVDRGRGVRHSSARRRSPRSTASSGSTSPRSLSTAACTRPRAAGTEPGQPHFCGIGWKWSVAVDRHGVPIGWTHGANRNDVRMLEPTLDDFAAIRPARGHRHDPSRTRLRLRRRTRAARRLWPRRRHHPAAWHRGAGQEATSAARAARDRRTHQHVGGRTTPNSAATPTARHHTATTRSASPPSCCSSANSSPGATAGGPPDTYPLKSSTLPTVSASSATRRRPSGPG